MRLFHLTLALVAFWSWAVFAGTDQRPWSFRIIDGQAQTSPFQHRNPSRWRAEHPRLIQDGAFYSRNECLTCHDPENSCNVCHEYVGAWPVQP